MSQLKFKGLEEGTFYARDLVSEPGNVLHPDEYAKRIGSLKKFGLKIKIYDERKIKFKDIDADHCYVDAMALNLIRNPWEYDVMVMENMFGDILSDLGGGLIGGMGMASCAEIGDNHGLFQPAHGSAPDILGQDKANPLATILSASLMLEYLSDKTKCKSTLLSSRLIETAIEIGFERNELRPIEFGGDMGTTEITETLSDLLKDNEIQKQILT